jgi:hypothetical protein
MARFALGHELPEGKAASAQSHESLIVSMLCRAGISSRLGAL